MLCDIFREAAAVDTHFVNVNKICTIVRAWGGNDGYCVLKVKDVCRVSYDHQPDKGEEHPDTTCRAQ